MDYSRIDPLISISGEKIDTAEKWEKFRREEIMVLLTNFIYGVRPMEKPADMTFSVDSITEGYMGYPIVKKDITISFNGFSMEFFMFLPQESYKKKTVAGVLHVLNESSMLKHDPVGNPDNDFLPITKITGRGYACVVLPTYNVAPDFNDKPDYKKGIFRAISPDPSVRDNRSWSIISAWAYGASRVMDYLETDRDVKHRMFAISGHSRAGKTALWACATDPRFWLAISNDSGSTGAAFARGKKGEDIKEILHTRWFCGNYDNYANNEDMLPCDQHMLLSAIAPRPVYVKSNIEDIWSDPDAELKSCKLATPVYEMLGRKGLVMDDDEPQLNKSYRSGKIGYHVAPGGHDLNSADWDHFLDFIDDKFWVDFA